MVVGRWGLVEDLHFGQEVRLQIGGGLRVDEAQDAHSRPGLVHGLVQRREDILSGPGDDVKQHPGGGHVRALVVHPHPHADQARLLGLRGLLPGPRHGEGHAPEEGPANHRGPTQHVQVQLPVPRFEDMDGLGAAVGDERRHAQRKQRESLDVRTGARRSLVVRLAEVDAVERRGPLLRLRRPLAGQRGQQQGGAGPEYPGRSAHGPLGRGASG
mmetsp:Transcript_1037/g.3319  ORF Transcript_1037/g.3319 Transcript_1037/m.3319 type:complete len:214 (+) Transcript_1037:868-1509(+)